MEVLQTRARLHPARSLYLFLAEGEEEWGRLTYSDLDRAARAIGAHLQQRGARGERALLLYPPGLNFVSAFLGCCYGGAAAVPAYPPRGRHGIPRLAGIVADSGPRIFLTTVSLLSRVRSWADRILGARAEVVATDALVGRPEAGAGWRDPGLGPGSLAFIQYTSGSTGSPKGVMVSHGALLHNEEAIRQAFGTSEGSTVVSWLPPYHDMGLVGGLLQPLYTGSRAVLMAPNAFLQQPVRWLRAIERYQATISGGPNFAYDLCVRKVSAEERRALDLSSWEVAFDGAEPVRPETLERFAEAFGPCGFRRQAFAPCYGLAEATLLVSGGRRAAGPMTIRVAAGPLEHDRVVEVGGAHARSAWSLASSGPVAPGLRVEIVRPDAASGVGEPCEPGAVGEIWVSGPSVAQGYWARPGESARVFDARLAGGEGPFLRTGDLGAVRHGEVFVTGRLKDLVIVRGRNLYPQDVEATAERSHEALRPGCGAAFGVEVEGEERLVLVHEVERRLRDGLRVADVVEAVARAVAEEHEVVCHEVVLIETARLPKTSSGKVQRRACRDLYLAGELPVVGRSVPAAEWPEAEGGGPLDREALLEVPATGRGRALEAALLRRIAALARLPPSRVRADRALLALGLDSLTAMELRHEIEAGLGVALPWALQFEELTAGELASTILERLPERGAAAGPGSPGVSVPEPGPHPLSHGQEALWLVDRLRPEAAAYHVALAAVAERELDPEAFRRAVAAVVARHSALRTTLGLDADGAVQEVREEVDGWFRAEEAPDLDGEALARHLSAEAYRPFDLGRGPLFRVRLLGCRGGRQVVLFAVHHLIADFWSFAVLVRELSRLYRQETGGPPAGLAPPPSTYAAYCRWQRQWAAGEEAERQAAFWLTELAGAPALLELPTDRPRPPEQGFRGAARASELAPALVAAARELAAGRSTTLFGLLLCAFQGLLARYAGRKDVVVGVPTAGRRLPETSGLVGYFVNPVALRGDLSGSPSFAELLERTRPRVRRALRHADYPFALLVQRLRPERDPSFSPVFQVMFVLQQDHPRSAPGLAAFALGEAGARLDLAGVPLASLALRERRAPFDLTLAAAVSGERLRLSLVFDVALFDPVRIERMARQLSALLVGAVADPLRPVDALPLFARGEAAQVLLEWNGSSRGTSREACLHELFAAQAARTPDAVALLDRGRALSYRHVDEASDRLAGRLGRLAIGPEDRVAVCLHRTPRLMWTLLGILKAGAAYVPLDPAYPAERLAFALEDARVRAVVTEPGVEEALPRSAGRTVLRPEDGAPAGTGGPPPTPSVLPGNLAYLIYTSGSTGRPKAVAIEHRSAAALVHWALGRYSGPELAGVWAATSVCFDLSVFELLVPLACGGTVILGDHLLELAGSPHASRVSLVNTVPSALAELVELGSVPGSVRTVNLAGEPLRQALVEGVHERAPSGLEVINLYGPSEDTTYSTVSGVLRAGAGRDPAIGRPVEGTGLFLLDPRSRPVPIGVPGEIHLAGAGLARCYLGRPALTAEGFVPSAFGTAPGERLFRTGDRGCHRWDGQVEFLGRADHQVKVRGFRIELGEVETCLLACPGVREAAVAVREDAAGGHLAAFVAAAPGVTPAAVGEFVRGRLPDFMVPSPVKVLEALPHTPSGKVDRAALPADAPPAAPGAERPGDPVEEVLVGVWSRLLERDRVGVHDDFFDLGGHSLLATRLVSRVEEALGVRLEVAEVFGCRTPRAQADLVRSRRRPEPAAPPLEPVARGARLPPSFAQERIWFSCQLDPGSALYNLSGGLRLVGALSVAALAMALRELVLRHEALRTTFPAEEGRPFQRIAARAPAGLPGVVDLRGLEDPSRRAREARRLARAEAQRPFDLAAGPLLRAVLVRERPAESLLLVSVHHAVADGWSLGILLRDLGRLYRRAVGAPAAAPPALPYQYADFAAWQRRWLAGEVLESRLDYWRRRLEGAPTVLDLPTDRPRPPAADPAGGAVGFALESRLGDALKDLARRHGATPFMTLAAAFEAVLARWTGQRDLLVGTPVAGRTRREMEPVVGCFVNTVVLRGWVAPEASFAELLGRVREDALGAYEHQDLPFERLVEELRIPRSARVAPLVQVLFSEQPSLGELALSAEMPGVEAEPVEVEAGVTKFDLALNLELGGEGIRGVARYRRDLFDQPTVERALGALRSLLEAAVADPARRLADLPLLSEAEVRRLLAESDRTGSAADGAPAVHQRFARRAEEAPDRIALRSDGRWLTYGALRAWAGRIAGGLAAAGAGPEAVVGLLLERSTELVAAVLGVLEAGAAFLPLDPAHPEARRAWMLESSGARIVLTRRHRLGALAGFGGLALAVDGEAGPDDGEAGGSGGDGPVEPRQAAYVLYTSGSTGRPKGITVSHGSLRNYLAWVEEELWDPGIETLPFLSQLTFDASLKQLFTPLLRGDAVTLLSEETATQPEELLTRLGGLAGLGLNCVPTLWRAVLDTLRERPELHPAGLTALLLGGEECDPGLLERTWAEFPGLRVWNLYGPTEVTCNATAGLLEPGRPVTLGRAVLGTRLQVLDGTGGPVPPGFAGELFVAGAGVARGYLGEPGLTAERFVPDPYASAPGERRFRTGDGVRLRPGGGLDYLGRLDAQVKVSGHRVELGEVEAVLARHPAVRRCAAAVRPGPGGSGRLVAFVVPRAAGRADGVELRAWLARELPAYMVPARFVRLEDLPRTTSGKLDRRALASLEVGPEEEPAAPVGALTPNQELLAELWTELLERRPAGPDDDFFELGGHSLLATRLISRVRRVFEVELPIRAVFEAPTLAGLAQRIRTAAGNDRGEPAPPIAPAPRDLPLPLSFAQERLWFLDRLAPRWPGYNLAGQLVLRGRLHPGALGWALSEVARRHEVVRTVFEADGGRPVQRVLGPRPVALPVIDLTRDRGGGEAARLAAAEARRPFDLATGPLLRAWLLRTGEDEHVLLVTLHHIVADGWSLAVLAREVLALYSAWLAGRPAALPELPLQYGDFAVWQRRWLAGDGYERRLDAWRARLAGAPALLELPADRVRPKAPSRRGGTLPVRLPPPAVAGLRALGRRHGASPFMVLLAAFQALLAREAGVEDLVVGSPVANRTRGETEDLIGFFVNTLPLRGDLSGDPTFEELLERVRRETLRAYEHQDVPLEKVLEGLPAERGSGHNPLFQVMLGLQNTPAPDFALPGIEARLEEMPNGTAKLDLTLLLRERQGELEGTLEYDADLFDRTTTTRLARRFERLLGALPECSSWRVSRVPLTSGAERHQVLLEWGRGPRMALPEACVHELFSDQARRRPDAVALRAEGETLTYRELDRRSGALARRLRTAGVGPGTRVALGLERSVGMVVALLAILKAGGAYLPVDPALPAERRRFLLTDAGAAALVVPAHAAADPAAGVPTMALDPGRGALEAAPGEPELGAPGDPDHLAYVLFTSGSTGRPKGVGITHRNVVRLVHGARYAALGPDEVFLQLAPLAFDASTFEIWGCLLAGGRLEIAPAGVLGLHELERTLADGRVSTLWLTAGLFHQVVQERCEALGGLRQLLAGGDVLAPAQVRKALGTLPGCALRNGYGPTEATTFAVVHAVDGLDRRAVSVPIGRPITNTSAHILDGGGEPVPVGVPGELHLGGDGLARAYWRRPARTAESFLPYPWSDAPGGRLYRTGDRARFLPDGSLAFLGRLDQQVKLRGFRVELGEIEHVLGEHPAVGESLVIARSGVPGGPRLAAYVVPAGEASPAAPELRAHLRRQLPEFMVPPDIVVLEAFPLTANGKVDRRALPAPEAGERAAGHVATRTAAERTVAGIWAELLGREEVGVTESFFDLGGHSLLAIQVISRMHDAFGVEVTLQELFDDPTVAGLALAATRARMAAVDPGELERALARIRSGAEGDLEELLQGGGHAGSGRHGGGP